MQLTVRTLFVTEHAHILKFELNMLLLFACLQQNAELHYVQEDQLQNIGVLAHTYGESSPFMSFTTKRENSWNCIQLLLIIML